MKLSYYRTLGGGTNVASTGISPRAGKAAPTVASFANSSEGDYAFALFKRALAGVPGATLWDCDESHYVVGTLAELDPVI